MRVMHTSIGVLGLHSFDLKESRRMAPPCRNIYEINKKESRNRFGVAQRVPGGLRSQIFMTFGTWRWWGRHPHAPAAFTPGMFLVLIFNRGWADPSAMVRSEGDTSLKSSVIPPGIDPGTVRLVAQRLSHYATPGPEIECTYKNSSVKGRDSRKIV